MCTYSMIADHYQNKWTAPNWPYTTLPNPTLAGIGAIPVVPEISRAEFDELKRDVLEMKELLKKAKEYDERNGEPDCEMEEKVELIRKVAKLVGVDLGSAAP